MKSLLIGACLCSAVAVAAPQFPGTATLASAGSGMDVRPISIYGEVLANGSGFSPIQLGTLPGDFVLTDVIASSEHGLLSGLVLKANGSTIASFGPTGQSYFGFSHHFQHGIPIPGGSQLQANAFNFNGNGSGLPMRVTIAGYLR